MRYLLSSLLLLFLVASLPAQQTPDTSSSNLGPAGLDAGDYIYISGQSARRPDGSISADFADQVRDCLENVRNVVQAAGLAIEHVVYLQVYLEDVGHYRELNQVFARYFPRDPPARAVLGVARNPVSPVQITAVAVRDLRGKRAVSVPNIAANKGYSLGMLTHDRLFVSSRPGANFADGTIPADTAAQVNLALDGMKAVAEAAGLALANMVFVNPYLTSAVPMRTMNEQYARRFEFGNTPARATIQVTSLPEAAQIAYTGVAVRDLNTRRSIRPKNMPPSPTASPCVFAGDTLYCSSKSGFIPGPNGGVYASSTKDQTRQTMRNLLDNLEEAEMSFDDVVSTTIYLDDLKDLPQFAEIYKKYFKGPLPSQTVVQQLVPADRTPDKDAHYPDLEQVSLIAVRGANRSAFKPVR
ncbi:MAG TPA: RidA family protein [Candidatus Eremiobacteraceae bacterium]|nr:RidA family protein [Candidatus Eremiobacteraceae bacterium]